MITKRWTMDDIKTACHVRGSHWFDPGTMRYFKCRILETVYQGSGGVFFVSSEKYSGMNHNHPRRYTVRKFDPESADISTAGEFNNMTKYMAIKTAKELAGPDHEETNEPFHPVTVEEQFLHDLQQHGCPTATLHACCELMTLADRHHKIMEDLCSHEWAEARYWSCDEDGERVDPKGPLKVVIDRLEAMAERHGFGLHLTGDPRGCTVKLVLPDGHTNDWGKDGYCVPTAG